MRCPAAERPGIVRPVEQPHLPARRTPRHPGIAPATLCRRCERHRAGGPEALEDRPSRPDHVRGRTPDGVRGRLVDLALAEPGPSPREAAACSTGRQRHSASEASGYRLPAARGLVTGPAFAVVEAADEFHTETTAPNRLRQTDSTCLEVVGRGWFHLSAVPDGLSRHVVAWRLRAATAASGVAETPEMALTAPGRRGARVRHRPRPPSGNGPGRIAAGLADRPARRRMERVRGAPCRPQTQGRIGRRHRAPRNRVPLGDHCLPGGLEAQVAASAEHRNHRRRHGSPGNPTPADVCFGRGRAILPERGRIRRQTIQRRRLLHRSKAAQPRNPGEPDPPLALRPACPKASDDGHLPPWRRNILGAGDRPTHPVGPSRRTRARGLAMLSAMRKIVPVQPHKPVPDARPGAVGAAHGGRRRGERALRTGRAAAAGKRPEARGTRGCRRATRRASTSSCRPRRGERRARPRRTARPTAHGLLLDAGRGLVFVADAASVKGVAPAPWPGGATGDGRRSARCFDGMANVREKGPAPRRKTHVTPARGRGTR